jgi:asparagine synthase (glutamine-hydrolysing)
LSILDLSPAGHQPMVSRDERHVLVFNGEIYNFRELRAELTSLGRTFVSTGDAEVLLAALAEWGSDALRRLNGMFALGFYDRREHRLLLARDHAGIKPLHYGLSSQGLVFASQYDQILAHPWIRGRAVDPEAVSLYLRFGFVPAPYGLHRDSGQLEAGEWLEAGPGGVIRRGRLFELPTWREPDLSGSDAIDAFDGAFRAAVKRQLVADVPVGVLLSGGIDSPLVAAEARRQHGGRIRGFTIAVDDPDLDESEAARAYAQELDIEHVEHRVTTADALALLDDVIQAATEPTADYSMFPTLMVSQLARRDVTVVLSGDGGDELYWGYPSRFGPAIAQAPYFALPRPARYAAIAARRFGLGSATRDLVEQSSVGRLYQRKHTALPEATLRSLFPELRATPAMLGAFSFDRHDRDHAAQWVRWNEFRIHLARVLAKVDRASMFHSLEVRVPLLDREVIDVAVRTDWKSCLDLRTRSGKRVLRAALGRRVQHQTRSKKGFSIPMYDWLTGPLLPLVREQLLGRRELLGVPLDATAMRDVEMRLMGGQKSLAPGVWLLLALSLWERKHLQGSSCT